MFGNLHGPTLTLGAVTLRNLVLDYFRKLSYKSILSRRPNGSKEKVY
jgi:hypothetical protein